MAIYLDILKIILDFEDSNVTAVNANYAPFTFLSFFTFLVEEVRKNKQGPPFAGKRRINKSHFYCSGKKDTVISLFSL